jgi:hypothetical protein
VSGGSGSWQRRNDVFTSRRLPVCDSAIRVGSGGSALGLAAGGLALVLRGGSGLVERGTWATGGLAGHLACVVEDWISGT